MTSWSAPSCATRWSLRAGRASSCWSARPRASWRSRCSSIRARSLGAHKSIGEVYAELAAEVPRFVDVLAEVRKRVTIAELNATSDLNRLYDTWLRTRDEWVEKKLKQAGLLVDPGSKVIQ